MSPSSQTILIIGGPTASGKSHLAQLVAQNRAGVIINADSQQVYADLRILTARPSPEEEAQTPHRLFGVLPGSERCSAARWAELVKEAIDDTLAQGKLPIVVGGTGLYLRTLMEGIAPIPEIPAEVRAEAASLYDEIGGDAFKVTLKTEDPVLGEKLEPGDRQRLIRAWEVVRHTGRPLSDWQQEPATPLYPTEMFRAFKLVPVREALYAKCDERFGQMLDMGASEEVQALLTKQYDPSLPVMKVIGVPELAAYLRGEMTREEAMAKAQQATRNYAKRQLTWFRHQMKEAIALCGDPASMEQIIREQL